MTRSEKQHRQKPALDEARQLVATGEVRDLLQALDHMYPAGKPETQTLVQEFKSAGERYLRAAHPWGFPGG
jgi:hypothetical protein